MLNKQTRSRKGSKRQPKKRSNHTDGVRASPNSLVRLPRSVTQIMPDRLLTKLTYKGFTGMTIPAAGTNFSRRWMPTAAFDIDPLLGSTTVVGYTELSAFYNAYRVNSSVLTCRFANTTNTPCQGVIVPLNADPGVAPTLPVVQSWENNPYSVVKLVPSTGATIVSSSRYMSTEKLYGTKMVLYDDNFASLTNTIPVNNWFWAVAILSPGSVAVATTIQVEVDITIQLEFYDRKALLN